MTLSSPVGQDAFTWEAIGGTEDFQLHEGETVYNSWPEKSALLEFVGEYANRPGYEVR